MAGKEAGICRLAAVAAAERMLSDIIAIFLPVRFHLPI
jgi:hypothetical protein